MSLTRKNQRVTKKKFKAFLKYLEVRSTISTHEHGEMLSITLPRNSSIEVVRRDNTIRILIDETVIK